LPEKEHSKLLIIPENVGCVSDKTLDGLSKKAEPFLTLPSFFDGKSASPMKPIRRRDMGSILGSVYFIP